MYWSAAASNYQQISSKRVCQPTKILPQRLVSCILVCNSAAIPPQSSNFTHQSRNKELEHLTWWWTETISGSSEDKKTHQIRGLGCTQLRLSPFPFLQLSATPQMALRKHCPKVCNVIPIYTIDCVEVTNIHRHSIGGKRSESQ